MRRVARSRATAGGASRGEDARATAQDQRSLARAGARPQRSPFVAALLSLRRNPLAMAGMAVFAFWLLAALLAPVVAPYDPNEQHFDAYRLTGPSAKYYFGTDDLGRDIFSRVLYGARVSVPAGFGMILAMAITAVRGGPGVSNALIAIVLVLWPEYARVMRGAVLALKGNEYVLA